MIKGKFIKIHKSESAMQTLKSRLMESAKYNTNEKPSF